MVDRTDVGATMRDMLLGAHLRRLREGVGWSREDAGWEIRKSELRVARMEQGRVPFKERDVADLLNVYGVDDEAEAERVLGLARIAHVRGWWLRRSDDLPAWRDDLVAVQAAASTVGGFDARRVPALLQTAHYAEAVLRIDEPDLGPKEVALRLQVLLDQQAALTADLPPQVWIVLDETVLQHPVGGVPVLREQIEALLEATKLPSVRLQILPSHAAPDVNPAGSFQLLGFPEPDLPDVVLLDELTQLGCLDDPSEVGRYRNLFELLRWAAEPVESTVALLEQALQHLDRTGHHGRDGSQRRRHRDQPTTVDLTRADLLGNHRYQPQRLARSDEVLLAWFGTDAAAHDDDPEPALGDAVVSTEVYLATDDHAQASRIYTAVDRLAELLGYDGPVDQEILRGSIWRRAKAVLKGAATSDELRIRLLKMERALELHGIESRQAEVNVTHSEAIRNLLAALDGVPSACVRVGSILLAKFDDGNGAVVLTRSLSPLEVQTLERFPEIQKDPRDVLNALALAIATIEEPAITTDP